MNRRGFFGSFAAVTVGSLVPIKAEPKEVGEMRALGVAFEQLRAQMERPITMRVEIDGRKIAEQVVKMTPQLLAKQGLL